MHSLRALNRNPHLRRSKPSFPSVAHVYNGHSDLVRAVDFRTVRSGGTQTFQLVSWSKDQTLRLWCIDEESLQVRSLNAHTQCSYLHASSPVDTTQRSDRLSRRAPRPRPRART